MKKLFFILISLPLFFSNCQQNNPSPSSSPAPPACCTFSASGLNYNPTVSFNGSTQLFCDGSTVSTDSNGDITSIQVQFHSFCTGWDRDWDMAATIVANVSPIISGQTYTQSGPPTVNGPLLSFWFQDWHCTQTNVDTYVTPPDFVNGTVNFVVDFANSEVSGTFTITAPDALGVLPPKTVTCTFSNMPFIN